MIILNKDLRYLVSIIIDMYQAPKILVFLLSIMYNDNTIIHYTYIFTGRQNDDQKADLSYRGDRLKN